MHTDIKSEHWVLKSLPPPLRPCGEMMRLDRPVGWWLLLLPCWWSLALAFRTTTHGTSQGQALLYAFLFLIGAILMRSAGCIINDLWDRHIDAQVERTKMRPIASGAISPSTALIVTGFLLSLALVVLLQFNLLTRIWALGSLVLVVLYPLAKRVTHWPQFVLGLTFNWGGLVGWISIREEVALPAFLLYASGLFWTLAYDTVYAHQDKQDDVIIGVKSTALKLGSQSKIWVSCFSLCQYGLLAGAGFIVEASWLFFLFSLFAGARFHFLLAITDLNKPQDCIKLFRDQSRVGVLIAIACLLA